MKIRTDFVTNSSSSSYLITLKSVVVSDSVTHIGERAFAWCYKLKDVTIQGCLTRIDDKAFEFSKSLVIHAPVGSIAEQYARDNNIMFEPM